MCRRRCGACRAAAGRLPNCVCGSRAGVAGPDRAAQWACPPYGAGRNRHASRRSAGPAVQRTVWRATSATGTRRHTVCGSCLRHVHSRCLLTGACAAPRCDCAPPSGHGAICGGFCQSHVAETGVWSSICICARTGCCRPSDPYPYGQGTTNAGVAVSTNCMTGSGYTPKPTMKIIENIMTAMTPRGSPTRFSPSPSKYIFRMTQP